MALLQQAMEAANRAVSGDGVETPAVSAQQYLHASALLNKLSHMHVSADPNSIAYRSKADEYCNRAAAIHAQLGLLTTTPRQLHSAATNTARSGVQFVPLPNPPRAPTTTTTHVQSNRAPHPKAKKVEPNGDRLFKQAKSAHNDHNYLVACNLYKQSAAAFLKQMKNATTASTKATLQVNAETAINAAEMLHVALGHKLKPPTPSTSRGASPTRTPKASPKPTRAVSIKPTTPTPTNILI
eukprot:m.96113 g.96113  ORF g.96113 m.96113 type:complete len:240 (-) comp26866_c1_seq1:1097-1816(-)